MALRSKKVAITVLILVMCFFLLLVYWLFIKKTAPNSFNECVVRGGEYGLLAKYDLSHVGETDGRKACFWRVEESDSRGFESCKENNGRVDTNSFTGYSQSCSIVFPAGIF